MHFDTVKLRDTWFKQLNLNSVDIDRTRLLQIKIDLICVMNKEKKILLLKLPSIDREATHGNDVFFFAIDSAFFFFWRSSRTIIHFRSSRGEGANMNSKGFTSYPEEVVTKLAKEALSVMDAYFKSGAMDNQGILDKRGVPFE